MTLKSFRPTVIIPTKNRAGVVTELLSSLGALDDVEKIRPEIIVADNDSHDSTHENVQSIANNFPTTIKVIKVTRRGKSAAMNEALKVATGDVVAFLDDDVVVDKTWLTAVENFFRRGEHRVGQGIIRLPAPDKDDPELVQLIERFRTIPKLEYKKKIDRIHSLNGANFFAARAVCEQVGGFDERLGPGAAGTSEDVEFARRLLRANIRIGYAPQAIVYHRVDRSRLTEEYFKQSHVRQGGSRFLITQRSTPAILFNLARAATRYAYYTVRGKERDRYRCKGRMYHYLGMMEAKQNHGRAKTD